MTNESGEFDKKIEGARVAVARAKAKLQEEKTKAGIVAHVKVTNPVHALGRLVELTLRRLVRARSTRLTPAMVLTTWQQMAPS